MRKVISFLLAVSFLLCGCWNSVPMRQSEGVEQDQDEQTYINNILKRVQKKYSKKNRPKEITLYRFAPLSEEYEIAYIENWELEVRYEYYSNKFEALYKNEEWSKLSSSVQSEMRIEGTISYSWRTSWQELTDKEDMTEEEAEEFLLRQAGYSDLIKYGDTDYYVNSAVKWKKTDRRYNIMWQQGNHVFEVYMPPFSEISEENITEYCSAEAFTVLVE